MPRKDLPQRKYRSFETFWPRAFVLLAFFVLGCGWIMSLLGHAPNLTGNLFTATIAAASLIYSLGRGQEATKDQYTLSLVARRFDEGGYAANVRMASDLKRSGKMTPQTTIKELFEIEWVDPHDEKNRMRAAYVIVPIMNYWEHVCTAYVDDRITRRIFEDLVQDLIRDLVGRYRTIIGDMRREDPSNMEHLCAVWFVIAPVEEHRKLVPSLGPVPERLCPDDQWRWQQITALHQAVP